MKVIFDGNEAEVHMPAQLLQLSSDLHGGPRPLTRTNELL